MNIETSLGNYRWIEDWVTVPASDNGRTHGIAVTKDGRVVVFHQATPGILIYSAQGQLLDSWGNFPGAHGLTLVEENGTEYLWLTDEKTKQVVKATLTGEIVQLIEPPKHDAYEQKPYIPTWATVGANGDIWVADGYGASLVHRYDSAGKQIQTLDGTKGAGRFQCPHGIAIDTRHGELEIYVADRGNKQFQVYGTDGIFRRAFGSDFLTSPDVSFSSGNLLIVPELIARVSVLDINDQPVVLFGANDSVDHTPDWPNNRANIVTGKFNSPHSATADVHGNIYVVEWITGGRVTKLEKVL